MIAKIRFPNYKNKNHQNFLTSLIKIKQGHVSEIAYVCSEQENFKRYNEGKMIRLQYSFCSCKKYKNFVLAIKAECIAFQCKL